MDSFTIRSALPDDIAAIADIYAEAVRHGTATYELDPPSLAEMRARFSGLVDAGFPYIVAATGAEILGYAYVGPFRTRPAYRFIVEDSIYIGPQAQGRGVGRLLLSRLITETTTLGFRQIIAVIGDGSPQSLSVRLHEKLGFRHCGTIAGSGYKHGRWLDTVLMQLELNGGTSMPPDPASLPERRFQGS